MRIMWFCIPAHGHTNPTLELVRELACRGHQIRYYSFEEFRERIEDAGAEYIGIDEYLPEMDEKMERKLRKVSTTEMTINAFRTAMNLDPVLEKDVKEFQPDLIVSDSVAFWGKLTAQKYGLPLVCSTTTFAFNQASSKYMKTSAKEVADILLGMGRVKKEIRKLNEMGYQVKSAMDIVQNKNDQDTIVYATEGFQPCAETFDRNHYCFMGPSVKDAPVTREGNERPLIYISLGTVINDHPDFYLHAMEALKEDDVDVLISCGRAFDPRSLGSLPSNVKVEQYVNQMEVLGKADAFITHCGMNSATEGLYMGVPEILFPLTGEQRAVARRVEEMGAGILLEKSGIEEIRRAVRKALGNPSLKEAAMAMREDFRKAPGTSGGADFIESIIEKR